MAGVVLLAMTFKPVVENDGIFYYSYLRAIVVEHSFDFSPEYAAAIGEGTRYDPVLIRSRNQSGTPSNGFPVGPALLSLPFTLPVLALVGTGGPQYSSPVALAYCLASLLAGLAALALAYRVAVRVVGSPWAAGVGVAAGLVATPLLYYLALEPSYSHTFSALAASAFVWWWWRTRDDRSPRQWVVLGLLAGIMAMTRFQDGALVAIAAIDLPRARWRALWLLPGAVAGFSPQVVVDLAQFGTPLPYRPAGLALQPLPGHYLDVLLSSDHGLLSWHPGIAVAAVGIAFVREPRLRLAFAIAALVEVLIGGAAPDWDGGFAFGGRRFLVLTPFFVLGWTALAARLDRRVTVAALSLLAAWNVALMANLTYVIGNERDPGYAALLAGQLRAIPYVPREFAQGAAVRALALWPILRQAPQLPWGTAILALEAACVGIAMVVALVTPGRRTGTRAL